MESMYKQKLRAKMQQAQEHHDTMELRLEEAWAAHCKLGKANPKRAEAFNEYIRRHKTAQEAAVLYWQARVAWKDADRTSFVVEADRQSH
jgi:hypothetical protein